MATLEIAMTIPIRSWPMWLFVAIALLLNASLPPLIEWIEFGSFEKEIQAAIFVAGVVVGESCFVVLLAGLTKRTWLGAYLFGLVLAAAGYSAVLGVVWLAGGFDPSLLAGLALLPLFLLVAASPLLVLRRVFGWRLVLEGEAIASWQPLRLADIFSQIAIVASVLVLARAPQVILENTVSDHWTPVAITCLILFGTSLVILPLLTRVAFGGQSVLRKAAWLMILPTLIAFICFGISQCFVSWNTGWSERLEVVPFLLTFLVPAIGIFYLSLLLLAASGMRLVRGNTRIAREASEIDRSREAHLRRLTWWRIGGAVAVTMVTSIYLANLQQWRADRDKENEILTRRADATGGSLHINDRVPSRLVLGPKATDADFAVFAICDQLEHLHLDTSKISDGAMANLNTFPRLRTLGLANIAVSDEALIHLKHLPKLETLLIVNCPVKGAHLADLPKKRRLTRLNLPETQFGDDECILLAGFPQLEALNLDRTRITDRSVESLAKLSALTRLELVGTAVERCPLLPSLQHLDLSQTKVNDAAIPSIARLSQLQFLSLRDTKVTSASIPSLASLKQLAHLDLSDNAIDDDAIRVLGRDTSLTSIDLSCTRVTGAGFAVWRSNSAYGNIILDRTLVDDKGVAGLVSLGEVYNLSLAGTRITDACLPYLAQIGIHELDIRSTAVTFGGLVNSGWPSLTTLRVAYDQFTPQQLSQLETLLGITVVTERPLAR